MVQVSIGCRVPESVKTELDEIAVLTGQSRGAIIVDALNEYLGKGKARTMANTVKDLIIRVESLEARYSALSSADNR